jgi:hypothetical protein
VPPGPTSSKSQGNYPTEPRPYYVLTHRAIEMEAWDDASLYASQCHDRLGPDEEAGFLLDLGRLMTLIPDTRGFDLIARAADAGHPEASLIMGVILEEQHPRRAAAYVKHAKRRWKGDKESWKQHAERVRKQWKPNEDSPSD